MINIQIKKDCTGCSACAEICPKKCIDMKADEEGFLYPVVNEKNCINCSMCEKVCPVQNTHFEPENDYPPAYLGYVTDRKDRIRSAAGGGFFALAEFFIRRKKGIVFGAVYDDDYNITHCCTENIDGLLKMQKSKYAQSDPKKTFSEARSFLKNGRYVLYSGTPCQIYGLKSYLKKTGCDQNKLFCIDLSCHGVPSPKLLKEYLDYQKRSHGSEIREFKMRDKKLIKNAYNQGFCINFENGDNYFAGHSQDLFGRCFWGEISSRPSCYDCSFKTVWRVSDITLGDCWFFDRFVSHEKDDFGVTMFLVHSDKGQQLLEECDDIKYYEADSEKLIKVNGGMIFSSAIPHPKRDEFFTRLGSEDFEQLVKSFFPDRSLSLRRRIQIFFENRGIRFEIIRKKNRQKRMDAIIKSKVIPKSAMGKKEL